MTNIYCFYISISARLAEDNSIIKLPILRALKSLELSFTHEFYYRLSGFTNMYNNGKTEPGKNFLTSYVLKFELDRRFMGLSEWHKLYKDLLSRPPCKT